MNRLLTTAAILVAFNTAAFADCGTVRIAEMNWGSAELMANVDKLILQHGYGCNAELIPGATMTTFTAMNEKGDPHVAPELWINTVREPLFGAIDEGRMQAVNTGPITELAEGWYVTPAFVEKYPELDTIVKILERPDLFPHSGDSSKGAFMGCPAGWGCQLANANLFTAFDMEDKGWVLVDPGSGAGLDMAIAKAANRDENWLGFYWAPAGMVGKHDMRRIEWGVPFAGRDNWDNCIVKPDCLDPQPTAYTNSEVNTVITTDLEGVAVDYFAARTWPGPLMNNMLAWMSDEQATGEDAAYEFLENYSSVWHSWVSEDAIVKIEASL